MTEKEVVMRLTFDSTKAAQGMKQVAEATQKAGQAARQTQQQFNAAQVAAERMARDRREDAVRAYMAAADPERYGKSVPAARPVRQLDQMADNSGALRFVRPLFAASAALSLGSGAARGVQDIAGRDLGVGRTIDSVASAALDAVPILGQLTSSLRQFGEVISGLAGEVAGQRFLTETHAIGLAGVGRMAEVRRGGRLRQEAFARGATDAGIAARGAAAYRDSLTPDVLASYRPRPLPGIADAQTGAARQAADQARAALAEAEERLAARRGEYDAAPERDIMRRAQGDWEWADFQARQGRSMARRATGELQRSGGFLGGVFSNSLSIVSGLAEWQRNQNRRADAAAGQGWAERQQTEANAAAQQYNAAQADLEKRRGAVADAEKEAAKARLDYEAKILDIRRNQLSLLETEVEKGRSGAVASGMAAPGDTAQIRAAVEQAQKYGFASLTQRQKGLVASDPDAADYARQQAEALGRNDPDRQAIRVALGKQDLWVQEESANGMRDAINADQAAVNAAYQKTIGDSMQTFRNDVVDAIAEAIAMALGNIRGDVAQAIERKMQDRAIGGQAGGG